MKSKAFFCLYLSFTLFTTGCITRPDATVQKNSNAVNSAEQQEKPNPKTADLYRAMDKGDIILAANLIQSGADINAKNKMWSGMAPLHVAAEEGYTDLVKLLISKGTDVNLKSDDGSTPLHDSSWTGRKDVAELLLKNGASINARDLNGFTPLHCALSGDYIGIVWEILEAEYPNVNLDNDRYRRLEKELYEKLQIDMVKLFINYGADVNAKDNWDGTPLHEASMNNCCNEVMQILIDHGTVVNAKDIYGCTPLHIAVESGSKETIEYLLSIGADLEVKNEKGITPLGLSISKDYSRGSRDRNKMPSIKDPKGYYKRGVFFLRQDKFNRAIEDFNVTIQLNPKNDIAYILRGIVLAKKGESQKAVVDWKHAIKLKWWNALDIYPLMHLLKLPDEELKHLIKNLTATHLKDLNMVAGKNIGYIGSPSAFFLVSLILSDPFEEEKFLTMTKDKNPYIRTMGLVCLAREDLTQYKKNIHSFYQDNAEVNTGYFDVKGGISLSDFAKGIIEEPNLFLDEYSCKDVNWRYGVNSNRENREEKINDLTLFLIEKGAEVNTKDNSGDTPLHYAASYGYANISEYLITHGAEIDIQNNIGETPLHTAVYWGYKDITEMLINKGADLNIRDSRGKTSLNLAIEMNYAGIAELLCEHCATE